MEHTDPSIDRLIDEIESCINTVPDLSETLSKMPTLDEIPASQPAAEEEPEQEPEQKAKKRSFGRILGRTVAMVLIFALEVVLLAAIGIYCAGKKIADGPCPSVSDKLAGFFTETGVFKKDQSFRFVANLFYSEEELAVFENPPQQGEVIFVPVEVIPSRTEPTQPGDDPTAPTEPQGPQPDAWGLIDEDGDGIILETVKGEGYSGYMMVVLDPSRVVMGTRPSAYGSHGYTVAGMVKDFNAVAGINAGGFDDPDGHGNGSIPDSLVVSDGKIYYAEKGVGNGFVGFDSQNRMHTGKFSVSTIQQLGIQSGVCFGPVLISNGQVNTAGIKNSGVNPRTAIGQRSDGAVLLLVIEGRQLTSLGATYQDLADIFQNYGAVNACNLDGGSSSLMWYQGDYINTSASVVGIRPVPTTFLVLAEGGQ